jgi:hypothetical protein
MKGNGKWHLIVPACALAFQVVPILFMRVIAWMAYAQPRRLPESWEWTVSMAGLALCAGASILLGSLGAYLLVTRSRRIVAAVMIALCCVPGLVGGAVYFYAVLVFLAVV